jgi:hypothetical protein
MNILFITHKDYETTRTNLLHIRNVQPNADIYFYNDLYKDENDAKECQLIRNLVKDIDLNIKDVYFTSENLGIKNSIPRALQWFYSNVSEGIIIEYDCIVSRHGFNFFEEAFKRFSCDSDITSISANNITSSQSVEQLKFIKTIVTPIWGWASWRSEVEAWLNFKPQFDDTHKSEIKSIGMKHASAWLTRNQNAFQHHKTKASWSDLLVNYQLNKRKYSIVPSVNLVKNIGFNSKGTNSSALSIFSNLKTGKYESFASEAAQLNFDYYQNYFKMANEQQQRDLLLSKLNKKFIVQKLKKICRF